MLNEAFYPSASRSRRPITDLRSPNTKCQNAERRLDEQLQMAVLRPTKSKIAALIQQMDCQQSRAAKNGTARMMLAFIC